MKHHKKHKEAKSAPPKLMPVCFECDHPTAMEVCIAGTFNDWQPEARRMRPVGSGYWRDEAHLLPGTYEYCLVVDGEWMPDPLARETVPNPFGGWNSVLTVAGLPEAAHLADAAIVPMQSMQQ